VRFWDSSAIVPLCLEQPSTTSCRAALKADPEMVVWWSSVVECASAIARLHRDGVLQPSEERAARESLEILRQSWHEVQPGAGLREQALRLLRLHHLRAADALQLAAALEWSGTPAVGVFMSFDDRLNAAAWREGFSPTQ
jgi:predicted nucleic acid-binding protein